MVKTVYSETSILSYYYKTHPGLKFAAWREITREWWKTYRHFYQTVTRDAVFVELNEVEHPHKQQKLSLVDNLEFIEHVPILDTIVTADVENKLVPEDAGGDAYHLAIASYCDQFSLNECSLISFH
jgi:hypothetical protein